MAKWKPDLASGSRTRLITSGVMIPAAFAIALMNFFIADLGVLGWSDEGPFPLVRALQYMFVVHLASFGSLAVIGELVLSRMSGRYGIHTRAAPGTMRWHAARFGVGYVASFTLQATATILQARRMPLTGVALLGSGAAVGTPLLSLFFEWAKPLVMRIQAALLALLAFTGIFVGISGGEGVEGFLNLPIGLGLVGALMLAVLPFTQKRALQGEAGGPLDGMPEMRKLMLTLKVSTIAALTTGCTAIVGIFATVPFVGWPTLPATAGWAALGVSVCYLVSQLLVQYGNGFGDPSLVNPLLVWTVPFSFFLDWLNGTPADLPTGVACLMLVAIATAGLVWLTHRKPPVMAPL